MKLIKFIVIFLLMFLNSLINCSHAGEVEPEIGVYIFYERNCEDCQKIVNEFLPKILAEYQEQISMRYFEISNLKNYETLVKLEEAYNDTENEFPIIIVGRYLLDYREIEVELDKILAAYSTSGAPFQKLELIKDAQYTETPVGEEVMQEDSVIKLELPKVYLAYFYEIGCKECDRVEHQIKYLQWKYPNIVIEKFDITDAEVKKLAEALGELYNVPEVKRMVAPSVFIGQDYLISKDLNDKNLMELIEKYKYRGTIPPWDEANKYLKRAEKNIIERFKSFGIITVVSAGLLDGINPCAFATLIFFISYLAFFIRKNREILTVGTTFVVAVFITYLLVGFGLLRVIQLLRFMPIVAKIVYMLTAGVAISFGVLSLYDYFRYRTGEYDRATLRLPSFMRNKIHEVIRKKVGVKKYTLGAFGAGFLISLLEFSCTGQVYLPTVVFVTKIPALRMKALFYLILYNVCFILPLLLVFFLAYRGMTAQRLFFLMRRRSKTVKLLTAVVFFCLAGLLIFYII